MMAPEIDEYWPVGQLVQTKDPVIEYRPAEQVRLTPHEGLKQMPGGEKRGREKGRERRNRGEKGRGENEGETLVNEG
jgi:hypothetical protein